jgi:molybdopterin synthase sulfur carrier subunit
MLLQIVYFARVREAVGVDGEQVEVEAGANIAKLIDRLARESERHAAAFSDRTKLRFALDQKMVRADAVLDGAKELAIFPPVTGG